MEAWDWLGGAVQLILAGHFTDEGELLALLVCPGLCRALLAVLVVANLAAGKDYIRVPSDGPYVPFCLLMAFGAQSTIHAIIPIDS